ncbi:MAG: T9SS type A sorting domain-containing protein, partial [Fulvivirga sp.]|nr:T9SS type A sorting domain-containing protein [Fulvivirga sp.]
NYNPYANESDNSCEYDEVITGQLDQEKGKAISVFPNPFSHYININGIGSEYEFVNIKIYDNKGVLVEELYNRSGNDRINTTNLSEGLYYLVVLSNDLQLIKTFKIHKQQ